MEYMEICFQSRGTWLQEPIYRISSAHTYIDEQLPGINMKIINNKINHVCQSAEKYARVGASVFRRKQNNAKYLKGST